MPITLRVYPLLRPDLSCRYTQEICQMLCDWIVKNSDCFWQIASEQGECAPRNTIVRDRWAQARMIQAYRFTISQTPLL